MPVNAQKLFELNQTNNILLTNNVNYVHIPEFNPLDKKVNYYTLGGLALLNTGAFVTAHHYQAKAWWDRKAPNNKFRAGWDGNYALYMDKSSHFLATHFLSHYITSNLEAANVQTGNAVWLGSIAAFAYEMYVEVQDGTAEGFIFSYDDAISDFLGAAYHVAQHQFPFLLNIQPRISYYPSEAYRKNLTDENVLDDYEGQKHWISFRIKKLLPESISKYWPSFLMISVGRGIKNYYFNRKEKHIELYIALDFDPSVLPIYGRFGEFIKNTLSYVHFPMPGVRISPNAAFFVFCY